MTFYLLLKWMNWIMSRLIYNWFYLLRNKFIPKEIYNFCGQWATSNEMNCLVSSFVVLKQGINYMHKSPKKIGQTALLLWPRITESRRIFSNISLMCFSIILSNPQKEKKKKKWTKSSCVMTLSQMNSLKEFLHKRILPFFAAVPIL